MKTPNIHYDFRLNDIALSTKDAVLHSAESVSEAVFSFLKDWFDDKDFVVVQTSGSTGKPKSIKLKKAHMINSALATGAFFNLQAKTKALLCLSPQYIAGKMMLVRALVLGWHLEVVSPRSNPLDGTTKTYDFCAMVPMQVENALPQLHRVKLLIVGGAPVSFNLATQLKDLESKIFETYGMTETITHIAVKSLNTSAETWLHTPFKSAFTTLPSIRITTDDRNCLVIDAPKVSTEKVVTNDLVNLLDDSHFEWLGRLDRVINTGGIKVSPEMIEQKLAPYFSNRFFIAGVNDDYLNQKIVLVCEGDKRDISQIPFDAILNKYHQPKTVYFVAEFIETPTQKIDRTATLKLVVNTI